LDYSNLSIAVNIPSGAARIASTRVARRHWDSGQVSYDQIFIPFRGFVPKKTDLDTALDVMEGILAAIYVHDRDVKELKIPERPAKPTD
jgi:hypothetical protein